VAMCIIHDWKTIYFNPSAVLLFGAKTQSEILNKHIYEFIHPDFQELAIENAKSLAEKGYVDMQEQQYIKLDGSILDVETQAKSIRFNDDTATLVVMNDITERKNAEKAMLESSLRLELAMQAANMAWWEMEMPSDKIIFNKRKAEMLGYSPENFKHYTDFMSLVHPEDAEKAMVAMRNHMYGTAKVYETEYRIVTNTGEYKWFYDIGSVVERDSTGNPLKITGLVLDVSKRKQWEELLKESEERYSSLLLHLETGIVVHARDTSIIMSNRRASEILGLTNDQMKGKTAIDPAWKFVDIDKTPLLLDNFPVNRIKNSKKSIKNQIIGIQKSLEQDITWVNINGFPVLNSIGEITEIVISFNDITERKKAETLLENERSLYLDLVNTQPAGIYRIRVFSKENWGEDAWTKADTPPYKIELMSDRFCEILEIDPQKFESHPGILVDLVHPDDKEEFVRRNEEANTLVSIFNWDCRLLINNNLKWIHFESLPRKLENGDILFTGIIYDITEQKIAQEKLRDSEMRFRKILQDVESLSVQGYAPDGTTQYWNKASERLYGYTAEEAIGKNFTDLIIPSEMREGVKQIIKQMAETGQALPASELSLMRKDGSMVTVFSNHTIVQIAGQPQELFCIDIDLTELKKAEEALRESEELLSLYIKNSPIYSFIKEVSEYESKVLYASENFIDMIGISGHEMIGKTMFELFPPEFAKKITADDWDVHKTSEVLKLDETLNGKDYITFKFPIVQGNRNLLAGFTIDISERKHAEELFIDIVDKNPMSIQIVDKEGHTLQTNPAFIELFGSIPPSYYSIFEDLISKGPEFETLIHQTINGEVVHLPDIYYNVHDLLPEAPNNPHWIRALIFPLKDINGKPERFVIMHEDITERKNAEQALKESEEKLSTLFSSMTEMVVMHQMIYNENGEAINYLITDCNKAFTDITGIRKEDAVGRLSTEVYRIETAPYLKEYANVCATGKSFDFNTYFAPMEKYFLISAVSIGNNRFSTISTDITTNEQIHEIIKEKNKELENYIYVAS
ncbi:MAG: PAS domain S-box protein, partial [Paludibacter sp.]